MAFTLAAVSLVGYFFVSSPRAPRRIIRASVAMDVDPETALSRTIAAMRSLSPDGEVDVDADRLVVRTTTGWSWKSFGEEVTGSVRLAGDQAIVELTSALIVPALIDYGRNRANVVAVVLSLEEASGKGAREEPETN